MKRCYCAPLIEYSKKKSHTWREGGWTTTLERNLTFASSPKRGAQNLSVDSDFLWLGIFSINTNQQPQTVYGIKIGH